MDSRDIKQEPEIQGTGYLEEIFKMQKELLNHYIGIESLPKYPVDVNTKPSQILLKDFTSRVIEELSEGYESLSNIHDILEGVGVHMIGESQYIDILNNLQNANEENADAIHFIVELMIYANITPEDIGSFINKQISDGKYSESIVNHSNNIKVDILARASFIGMKWLDDEIGYIPSVNKYNLLENYLESDTGELPEYNEKLITGGHRFNSYDYHINIPYILWQITHHLNIARNFLKNKPWKQSQVMTQEVKYQAELVKAFIYFCGYLSWIGLDSYDIFYIYFKKNHVNQFRIKSKY